MEHLYYCLREIAIINSFLKLQNDSFYKRTTARLIAIRTDDFIKLAFKLNKSTLNSMVIKNEINALQDLYKKFFKLQRDKFGAHFQNLDLGILLESWQQINLEKADFFFEIPYQIYNHFHSLPNFITLNDFIVDSIDKKIIEEKNIELSIEKYPNFSADILALTRPNSGGLVHGPGLQSKAGVLKSLELIISYELSIIESITDAEPLKEVFFKMFITDLVSYCDNFYGRTDIPNDAPQAEPGLDYFITIGNYIDAYNIIVDFRKNYKFDELLNELRIIRNKIGGHLDTSLSISNLELIIKSFEIGKFKNFYEQLKKLFRKICYTELVLRTFLMEPTERMYGVQKLVGLKVETFEGIESDEYISSVKDINDEFEYNRQWNLWVHETSEEARHFFWDGFASSKELEIITNKFTTEEGHFMSEVLTYRKAHKFFEEKLINDASEDNKIKIIELFIACRSGYPNTLTYILLKTYPKYTVLKLHYIRALGYLNRERKQEVFQFVKELFGIKNIYAHHQALITLFRIDIASRNKGTNISVSDNLYSIFIKDSLLNIEDDYEKIVLSLALSSELVFSNEGLHEKLKKYYFDFFEGVFIKSFKRIAKPVLKKDQDIRKARKIIALFSEKRYSTLLALIGDLFGRNKHKVQEKKYYTTLLEGLIKYSTTDKEELHNYAVVAFRLDHIQTAIEVSKYIIDNYPGNPDTYYLLLTIYCKDKKYKEEFETIKSYVLNSYNLTPNQKKQFNDLAYEE